MNIFAELIHSIYDFKSYQGYQKNSWPKTLLYGALLGLLVTFVTLLLPFILLLVPIGGLEGLGEQSVPEFVLEDGELWIAEPVEYKQYDQMQGGLYLRADTDHPITEEITNVDLLAYDRAIVMDAHHVILKIDGTGVNRFSYEELDLGTWTRDRLFEEAMPYIKVVTAGVMILLVWILLLAFFGGAWIVALIGKLMASMQSRTIAFGDLYKMAIHTRTLPLVLKMIYMWVPIVIPFFTLINLGISCAYMWKAIEYAEEEKPIEIHL